MAAIGRCAGFIQKNEHGQLHLLSSGKFDMNALNVVLGGYEGKCRDLIKQHMLSYECVHDAEHFGVYVCVGAGVYISVVTRQSCANAPSIFVVVYIPNQRIVRGPVSFSRKNQRSFVLLARSSLTHARVRA